MRLVFSLILASCVVSLPGQNAYTALLQQTDKEILYLYEVPFTQIEERNQELSPDGYELIDLEFFNNKCWGIWMKTGNSLTIAQAEGWEAFEKLKGEKIKAGQLLKDVEPFENEDGETIIMGFWQDKKAPHNIWKLPNKQSVEFHHKELSKLGLYLEDIETIKEPDGSLSYLALYHKGLPADMTHYTEFVSEEVFQKDRDKRNRSGYVCVDLEVAIDNRIPSYIALYKKKAAKQAFNYQLEWDILLQFQEYLGSNYKTIDIEINDGPLRAYAPPISMKRTANTPDIDMNEIPLKTKGEAGFKNQSAACAAANALVYLTHKGYEKLSGTGLKAGEQSAMNIAQTLANGNFMKTLIPNKTSTYSVIDGLGTYIEEEYMVRSARYYDIAPMDVANLENPTIKEIIHLEGGLKNIPLDKAKEGLSGSSIVLLKWGIYQADETSSHLEKKSTVWGTLVGYGTNEHGVDAPNVIVVHDPTDGNKTVEKYFEVEELEQFFMMTTNSKLQAPTEAWENEHKEEPNISALDKQFLSYYKKDKYDFFAVWEGLLIMKVAKKDNK